MQFVIELLLLWGPVIKFKLAGILENGGQLKKNLIPYLIFKLTQVVKSSFEIYCQNISLQSPNKLWPV